MAETNTANDFKHYMTHENVWGYKKRFDTILRTVEECAVGKKEFRIIDVGCGNGAMVAIPLAEHGFNVFGIDFDPISIDKANELAKNIPAKFAVGKASDFADTKYDFVICSEVLEHVHEYNALIDDLAALVKDDGTVFVTIPNGWGPYEIERFIFVRSGLLTFPRWLRDKIKGRASSYANSTENMDCGHVNFFTFNRMYNALAKHFTIRRVHHTTLFSGAVSHILFKNNAAFLQWNSTLVDKLPHAMSSGWYFVCSKKR